MLNLGIVRPGTTLYIPFHMFDSNNPSASVIISDLATTDIKIYKNGSTTQRASENGYTLLDTDGINFNGITGIHGISIDLSDNSIAGFYAAGSQYWVIIASITVDSATVNFVTAQFQIGYSHTVINTTIATLASQTSFTLAAGPSDNDALNGMWCVIHDVESAVQLGHGFIIDYVGMTKTVTLSSGTTFPAAATDNISIMGLVVGLTTVSTFPEPTSVPAAASTLADKISWLFTLSRNKNTQTSATKALRNDVDSADIATSSITDDGTTFTRNKYS